MAPPALAASSEGSGKIFFRQEEGENARIVPVVVENGKTKEIALRQSRLVPPTVSKKEQTQQRARGQLGFMFVSIGWSGAPRTDIDPADYQFLSDWSSEASDGVWRFNPVTVLEVDLPRQPSCDDIAWARATRKKVESLGYSLRNYAALGIVIPRAQKECVETAYAYAGCFINEGFPCGLSVYSHDFVEPETVVHELGHALGLEHANSLKNCQAFNYSPGDCQHEEYGDGYDPMGTSFVNNLFHPLYAQELGWMKGGIETVPLDGQKRTLSLDPYGAFTGSRALRFSLPEEQSLSGASPGHIALEYRTPTGLDAVLWDSYNCNLGAREQVLLRYFPSWPAAVSLDLVRQSYLLDMSSNWGYRECDYGMLPGQSWSDPSGRLRLQFQDVVDGRARLSLEVPSVQPPAFRWKTVKVNRKNRSVALDLTTSREIKDVARSDFKFLRGRCRLAVFYYPYFSTTSVPVEVRLSACTGNAVQLSLSARAFFDPLSGRGVPDKAISSPLIKMK